MAREMSWCSGRRPVQWCHLTLSVLLPSLVGYADFVVHEESRRSDFNPLARLDVFGGTERVGWVFSGKSSKPA